ARATRGLGWPFGPAHRWWSIVSLPGGDAEDILDLIDRDGPDAAITHLSGYDYGAETTDVELSNGHVYERIPTSGRDQMAADGDYRMTYNPAARHVVLYRQHTFAAEDRVDRPAPTFEQTPPGRPAAGR